MKPGGARMKGQDGEREVIKLIQPFVQDQLKRNLNQTREGGYDVVGIEWMALEVKRQETLDVENWWKQTLKQAGDLKVPVLVYRQNRKAWQVVMWGGVGGYGCRVTISMWDFIAWLKLELDKRMPIN